jgi:hypothetical protein
VNISNGSHLALQLMSVFTALLVLIGRFDEHAFSVASKLTAVPRRRPESKEAHYVWA